MIILLHSDAKTFIKATRDEEQLSLESKSVTGVFWELAERYPEELIVWNDEPLNVQISDSFLKSFSHVLIMASYSIQCQFIPEQIGYVDQLPFVNPKYDVKYPTWRMSTDIGGIYGKTALYFRKAFNGIHNFGYLLNSIAKVGQQNGLFCYSDPGLVENGQIERLKFKGGDRELFRFVGQHYKKAWLWVLFFCIWKYERRFPIISILKGFMTESNFKMNISLPIKYIKRKKDFDITSSIDVIIPTLFRAEQVKNLLHDLSKQSYLPNKVIIVEQNPDPESKSQLDFLHKEWPFKIVHHFIHKTGACHARNLALKEVSSDWVLFADDDIRIEPQLLQNSLKEIKRIGVNCLNLNSLQPGEKTEFSKIKQWGAFGSANALVKTDYALKCQFSKFLEYGFGEDIDYGMQLRDIGCDIIYHPELQFIHLKAKRGGFRSPGVNQWNEYEVEPKPSPTMMVLIKTYYSEKMLKGYKTSLYIKFYWSQPIKNPVVYFKKMQERWRQSEEICHKLQSHISR